MRPSAQVPVPVAHRRHPARRSAGGEPVGAGAAARSPVGRRAPPAAAVQRPPPAGAANRAGANAAGRALPSRSASAIRTAVAGAHMTPRV
jgi:hypothetical protein